MTAQTPRQRLADLILGRPVAAFIAQQRASGLTWPAVADALKEATAGEIAITGEAVRQWASREDQVEPVERSA